MTPTPEELDDAIRRTTETIWPEVVGWNQRMTLGWVPSPGSDLADDDGQIPRFMPSYLARTSLATASQHLMSVVRYLHNLGPTTMSLYSMLRTAIWGGAQAVWLLEPDDQDERLKRARQVEFYSRENYLKWLHTFPDETPTRPGSTSLAQAKEQTAERLAALGDKPPKIDQTGIVRDVAKRVHGTGPNPAHLSESTWRSLGAIAHALPWELDTRINTKETIDGSLTTREFRATWAEFAGPLCDAHEFTKFGWALLDQRSQPQPDRR